MVDAASIENDERERTILLQTNQILVAERDEKNAESTLAEAQRRLDRVIENRKAAAESAQIACK